MADAKKNKNIEVKLKGVRLSFAHLFRPKEDTNEAGVKTYSFQTVCLVPKKLPDGSENSQVKELQDAMKAALAAEWPDGSVKVPKERKCVRDGEPMDEETGQREPLYDGYAGMYYVAAKRGVDGPESPNPVQLLGPKKTAKKADGTPCFPRLKEADGLLYSGCYADVIIRIYAYNGTKKGHPHRINASLEAVKFVRHGDAFGAQRVDADAAFDEEEDDETGGSAGRSFEDDDEIG